MPTNTYVALDKVTVGSAVSSVTLSSINQGYTDLVLVFNGTCSTGTTSMNITVNSDTGSNYSMTRLYGSGSAAFSERQSNVASMIVGIVSNSQSVNIVQFQNYSNTTTYKTVLSRQNVPSDSSIAVAAAVGLWRSTSAITSITITAPPYNFASGSTFSLYGIAAASVGAKATGGVISSDSQYYYHTFLSSGTFTPTQSLTCDYLVVAGGGSGGSTNGGGGGAGGYRTSVGTSGGGGSAESPLSLASGTPVTVTIGAGGAGVAGSSRGNNGSNSVFSTITSTGGGAGGGAGGSQTANSGGSGGGGSNLTNGGAGTPNQGYAGSSSGTSGYGGGGAGQAATNSNGGNGVSSSITGSSVTRGGGGAGFSGVAAQTGGTGGGGGTQSGVQAESGTVNTGGGGGGNTGTGTGSGAGGSGIVIVRYAKA